MRRIRSGRGLGDNLYMRAVVENLLEKETKLEVCTDFPDLFSDLPVETATFTRQNIQYLCHYLKRHGEPTNYWQDICIQSGVPGDFRIQRKPRETPLIKEILAESNGRKILLISGGRQPMNRKDNFGIELLPDSHVFDFVLNQLQDFFRIQIGESKQIYPLDCDKNLNSQTTAQDILDLAGIADGLIGQCSFMIPLAEAFDKPLFVIWGSKALASDDRYLRRCTPRKILSKPTSYWVMDDWEKEDILKGITLFKKEVMSAVY